MMDLTDDRSEVNVEEQQEKMREIGSKHTIRGCRRPLITQGRETVGKGA
jgi:hypothetical protein